MVEILIKEKFPSLNQYTNANRGNAYGGAKIKKKYTQLVMAESLLQAKKKFEGRVHLTFTWYEKNKRRDPDNVAFNKKFVLDGLVKAGVIPNDTWNYVDGFEDHFEQADFYGVKVEIRKV